MADDWLAGGLNLTKGQIAKVDVDVEAEDDWLKEGLDLAPKPETLDLPPTPGVDFIPTEAKPKGPAATLFGTAGLAPGAPILPGQMEYLFQHGLISPKEYTMDEAGRVVRKDTLEPDRPLEFSPDDPVHKLAKNVFAAHEAGGALATGALLFLPAKAYGLMALPFGREAADLAEEYIASLGYQPRTPEGQAAGQLMMKGIEGFLYPSRKAGAQLSKTHPKLGYILETGGELAQFAMVGKAGKGIQNLKNKVLESRAVNRAQMDNFDLTKAEQKIQGEKFNELIKDDARTKTAEVRQREAEPMLTMRDWPSTRLSYEYMRRYKEGVELARKDPGKRIETPAEVRMRELREKAAKKGEIPEMKTTNDALEFGQRASEAQLKTLARERDALYAESKELSKKIAEAPTEAEASRVANKAIDVATQAQFRNEAIQASKGEAFDIKTIDKNIPTVEKVTPEFSAPTNSPFMENAETTAIQRKLYQDPQRQAAIGSDPDMFTMKLVNDVNRWYHGEKVDIAAARKGLNELATRADELWQAFDDPAAHRSFKELVEEASVWATQLKKPAEPPSIELSAGVNVNKAYNSVKKMYDNLEMLKKKPLRVKAKDTHRLIKRKFIDPSANIKVDLIKHFGDQGYKVVQQKNLARGANARAARTYTLANRSIYGGLNSTDQRILDRVVFSRRVIQIDKIHGKGKKKHPSGLGTDIHSGYLEVLRGQDPALYSNLMKRADDYFNIMRDQLKQAYDEELLTTKDYEALKKFDYSRRQLIDVLDPEYTFKVGPRRQSVRDSGVQELARGRDKDVLETDSNLMMLEVINRTQGRIMNNKANKALLELARANPGNPFVRIPAKGQATVPKGWSRVEVFEAGKKKSIYMPENFAKEWVVADAEMSYNLSNFMRVISGSTILRPMATGINPGFAFANLPRDLAHIWLTSQTYSNGKWESSYSPYVPIAGGEMARDLSAVFSDAIARKGRYDEYINEGGGMEFLVHQGRLLKKRLGAETKLDKVQDFLGYINETSEIVSRLALRERIIRKEAQSRNITMEQARKNPEITSKATAVAREYMDFGGYGGITKAIDTGIPYLGAAVEGTRGIFRSAERDPKTFGLKSAQLAGLTTGLYLTNRFNNPEALDSISNEVQKNNFVMTTPWKFIDQEGQTRHIYFTIPKDPGQRFMCKFFEAATQKMLGEEVDPGEIAASMRELSPVTEANALPPSAQSLLGYVYNKDFWMNEDIWRRGVVEPKEEFVPGRTAESMIDVGQALGLSPERLQYSLERLFTSGNMYSHLAGYGYNKLFGEALDTEEEQHIAHTLSKMPVFRRFVKVTNPYTQFAKGMDEISKDVNTQRWIRTRELDRLTDGYLIHKNTERKEIASFIRGVAKEEGTGEAQRLYDRFAFQKEVKNLPNRTFWLSIQRLLPEARAKVFKQRWDQVDQEKKSLMKLEMQQLYGKKIGKRVFSDEFFRQYNRL